MACVSFDESWPPDFSSRINGHPRFPQHAVEIQFAAIPGGSEALGDMNSNS
jgi:hypothetical protein